MKFIEVTNTSGNTNLINIDHIVRIYPAADGNGVIVLSSVDGDGKNETVLTTLSFEEAKKRLSGFVIDSKPTTKAVGFTRKD